MLGFLKLYDTRTAPNDPLTVYGYWADVYATRSADWTATKCVYGTFEAILYEVTDPHSRPVAQRGRTLKVVGLWSRDLTTVQPGDLTYPPGTHPSPAEPPFKVRAVEIT
jgi:hypothetical protein